jgi:predicted nuclease of predicted toxin-antitoxin system
MQFVADENIDKPIIEALRNLKLDVLSISELIPGCSDSEVLRFTNKKNSFLITSDKDFGEIIFRQKKIIKGVILLRLHGLPVDKKVSIIKNFFEYYNNLFKENNVFIVVSENNIRVRKGIY